MSWLKIFLVPILCYAPAFILVLISFSSSKPASTPSQDVNKTNLENLVKQEVEKEFTLRRKIPKVEGSPLAKEYLTGQIKAEAKDQAEKAAKDEIDKMKGDLFGQISFPVLFAIASIFAAFAVKDILTEILKEQEKERIKKELRQELKTQIVPKAIKSERLIHRLENVESYTNWLEYELLNIVMTQIIDEATNIDEVTETSSPNSNKTKEKILLAIGKLLDRQKITLDRVEFREKDLEKMRKAEKAVLTAKVKSIGLDEESPLLLKINAKPQITKKQSAKFTSEYAHTRMEEIFHMQMSLLIATLSKIGEDDLSSEIANYLDKDRPHEINERRKTAERESKQNPVKFGE
jgi:hypothetical protein